MQPLRYGVSGALRWQEFDGNWVVFCTVTGALLAPDALTGAVLSLLESGPATAADLLQAVADATGLTASQDMADGMAVLLAELQRIGMVEPQSL